jgi:hypothetical protein
MTDIRVDKQHVRCRRALSFQHDVSGKRTLLTYHSDGNYLQYDLDAPNRMTPVRENGATSGVEVLAVNVYDTSGHADWAREALGIHLKRWRSTY